MNTRLVLLAISLLPAFARSQEPPVPDTVTEPVAVPAALPASTPTFSLKNPDVRQIARDVAQRQLDSESSSLRPDDSTHTNEDLAPTRVAATLTPLPMRARRIPTAYDCLLDTCTAYDADGNILYTVPRTNFAGTHELTEDEWLSCQSSNDMLSTFERFDKCRGVGVSVPTPWDGVHFQVPLFGVE